MGEERDGVRIEGGQVAGADRRDGHVVAAQAELLRQVPDQNLDAPAITGG